MSYRIQVVDGIVHVMYYGYIDPLDIIRQSKDINYLKALRRFRKVIFDYSDVTEADISPEESRQFALLSSLESHFTTRVLLVFVLKSHAGRKRIEAYRYALRDTDWQVSITDTVDEAREILSCAECL